MQLRHQLRQIAMGGDDTQSISLALSERGVKCVGVPKTIDNDIHFIDRSFGFETSFSAAVDVIKSAHVEAKGAKNGVGLLKCMGRHSGFIACHAALASTDVDFVLIPEVPVVLEGETGLFRLLRLERVGLAQSCQSLTSCLFCEVSAPRLNSQPSGLKTQWAMGA